MNACECQFGYIAGAVERENRGLLWEKTRQALIFAYKNHHNDFDFFMKADDDTYVIVENLRFFLAKLDPNKPILMGRQLKASPKSAHYRGSLIALSLVMVVLFFY